MRDITAKRMVSVPCKQCGKMFHQYSKGDGYCSKECRNQAEREFRKAKQEIMHKVCPNCMKEFDTTRKDKIFCCNECTIANNSRVQSLKRSRKTKRVCPVCNRSFWSAHQYKKYCCKQCYEHAKREREGGTV